MKFELIQPVNQIESNLFVKHKVEDMKQGDFIQKCICCGEVIEDFTPKPRSFSTDKREPYLRGHQSGYLYINKSGSSRIIISESAITMGFFSVPKELIECTAANS